MGSGWLPLQGCNALTIHTAIQISTHCLAPSRATIQPSLQRCLPGTCSFSRLEPVSCHISSSVPNLSACTDFICLAASVDPFSTGLIYSPKPHLRHHPACLCPLELPPAGYVSHRYRGRRTSHHNPQTLEKMSTKAIGHLSFSVLKLLTVSCVHTMV